MEEHQVISVVGAGGKTTYIRNKAEEYLNKGYKVLITTTTHMAMTEIDCDSTLDEICRHLNERNWSLAGQSVIHKGIKKMAGVEPQILEQAIPLADIVLIEADGARKLPFKAPKAWEPVIHPKTSRIVIMAGLAATKNPIRECCYNWEDICKLTGKTPMDFLTRDDMREVVKKSYLEKFQSTKYSIPMELCFIGEETGWNYEMEELCEK